MKQLPPRHRDPLCASITFSPCSSLSIAFGSSPSARLLYESRRMLKPPFGIDGFGQNFGGHLGELLRRTVEAHLVAQLVLAVTGANICLMISRCYSQNGAASLHRFITSWSGCTSMSIAAESGFWAIRKLNHAEPG